MPAIVLATINARYFHAALGLRYLLANLGELRPQAALAEFVLEQRPADIVEAVLAQRPRIVGLGVYIWNLEQSTKVAALLKQVAPEVVLVVGGPEVSHEHQDLAIVALADYLITGAADLEFARLCRQLLAGAPPTQKVIAAEPPPLASLTLPYGEYTEEDVARRQIYVEASRGCPFKCAFCLSALDRTAWAFPLARLLDALQSLHTRGVRHFKFVDRTFNLDLDHSLPILELFLERLDERLFLHFEVVPDRLPERLRGALARFPPGTLQLEVGIQSFNPTVQALISRRQDEHKTQENLRWLRTHTHAHLHADLIVGLPGEDLQSFAAGFDRLVALRPHEIQVGILKRLRGAPIARHADTHRLRFDPHPPYEVLSTDRLDFATLQRLRRFARYWDLLYNAGRFPHSLPLLLGEAPFARFLRFADWLYAATGQTHRIALDRLAELLYRGLTSELGVAEPTALAVLAADYRQGDAKACPEPLRRAGLCARDAGRARTAPAAPSRQARHLQRAQPE